MTYGSMPLEDWERRQGNPYLEENGRWYRITDHHIVYGLKRVNYQAEECEAREVERYLLEAMEKRAAVQQLVDVLPIDEPPAALALVPAQPGPSSDDEGAEAAVSLSLSLSEYARGRGWRQGRISNEIKAGYRREHGGASGS